jgi:SpoVK/Ycf46/Vps4 family AAA+-type ATPase
MKVSYYVRILEELLQGERYMLAKNLEPLRLVRGIRKKRGNKFGEEDIAWSLDQAVKQVPKREKRFVLEEKDFSFTGKIEERPMERLSAMAGLGNVKTMIHEYAALGQEQMRNSRLENICSHMVFSGRPGTGKTECARIIAEIMAEQGQNNGNFVLASRKDIVGKYIGQTAPKVANLFRQARSGVLFVDEAGFFLQDSTRGSYNQEAIKEFVRYMETYQDVTVIFALYPHEVEAWMELDAGLSSRISRIVRFEDYTEEELVQIAAYMSGKRGYCMEKAAEAQIAEYIRKRKDTLQENFGNAREIRKLVESAIFARSIRVYNKTGKSGKLVLKASDFEKGAERLMQEEEAKAGKKKAPIGFAMMKEEDDGWNHADQEHLPKGKCSAVSMN